MRGKSRQSELSDSAAAYGPPVQSCDTVGFWMGAYRLKTGAREYEHGVCVCIRCKYPSENMIKYAYMTRYPTDWHGTPFLLSRNLPPYRILLQLAVQIMMDR